MKSYLKLIAAVLLAMTTAAGVSAQTQIVRKGKAKSRIVLAEEDSILNVSAQLLKRFIDETGGCDIPVVTGAGIKKNDIVLSYSQMPEIGNDGFRISNEDGILRIEGKANGPVYGAVTLLEKYVGVDYWGENEYSLKRSSDIEIPATDIIENPTFSYRQSQNYAMGSDPVYKWWFRLEEPSEEFAAGYWVHTFNRLLPSSVYGKEHPEYYSYFNGKRHPGKASQWCLTNPEVFEIVAARVDSIFKANPGQDLICISQNDGNGTNCTCPSCKEIDEREGSPSGSVIYFLNKMAKRFPDKRFATLAYLYTMNPPKHIRPEKNVVVMLCDIDCTREAPLTETVKGKEFVSALEGWAKITDNLFIWDYGINFDNYLAPFPNFHILQDNIRLFRDNNATMHFSQIASSRGGDFAELRTYLVSKLMWDADCDTDSLMNHFLEGYYGAAAPYMRQYIDVMEGALLSSGLRLWIYDSPVSHKNGMLRPLLVRKYNGLFDKAENAVADDSVYLDRVQRQRLQLMYSELEIARTESEKDYEEIAGKLDKFEKMVKKFEVPTLNERNNSPVEYCELYRERYMPQAGKPVSIGAKVEYIIETTAHYAELGKTALTDGLYGGASFVESWVGWEGTDAAFVVDLGEVKEVRSAETDFLHQIGAWILFPLKVTYSYSEDGSSYTLWSETEMPEDTDGKVKFKAVKAEALDNPVKARYVKVEITATKVCPHWHYGVGQKSWVFVDEVTVE